MPKVIPTKDFDLIIAVFGRDPGRDLSAEDLHRALGHNVPPRTLQRRLAALVASGRFIRSGGGRAARYRVADAGLNVTPSEPPTPAAQAAALPLSPSTEGRKLEALVRRPLMERTPVDY